MDQLTDSQQKYYVDWFKTMPLWLDLGDIRVFYGHYWRENEPVERDDFTDYTSCVDFSAVKHGEGFGTLVAYRWKGESKVKKENYLPPDAGRRA